MGLQHPVSYYDYAKILFFVVILIAIISLPNVYSGRVSAISSQSSIVGQGKNTPQAHQTAISVFSPEYVVSGTSITVMGKLFDIDANPPKELTDKVLHFGGTGVPGAPESWRSVRTGGFIFSDPDGIINTESCDSCVRDLGQVGANKYILLNIGSEISLPKGTHGVKLSLLNSNKTHYDINITKADHPQTSTIVSEKDQLLGNPNVNLNILFPEGISKISLIGNDGTTDHGQVGVLEMQTFDPAGDPENQTTIDFEHLSAPTNYSSPLSLDSGAFVSIANAVKESPGPFVVNVSFPGDSDYLPSSNTTSYHTIGSSFGVPGESGVVMTDYIGTVWTSLPNVCGSGSDTDSDGICDAWESSNPPQISCPTNTDGTFMDPLCTSSTLKYPLCFSDGFAGMYSGHTNGESVCPKVGHKDLYVEIDYMPNHQPRTDSIQDVIKSFASAPITYTPPVSDQFGNPGGITLHVVRDEQLPFEIQNLNVWQNPPGFICPSTTANHCDFRQTKEKHFGTVSERGSLTPTDVMRLNMKHYIYHYGIFAHSIGSNCGPSGISEVRGNDFIVSLGCGFSDPHPPPLSTGSIGNKQEQSGTLMHELGHNLNLDHGGARYTPIPSGDYLMNCKANYLSVMNYARQVPIAPTTSIWDGNPLSTPPLKGFLDYSSQGYYSSPSAPLLDLAEGNLNEVSGLTTKDSQTVVYGTADTPQAIRISSSHVTSNPVNPGINWNGVDDMQSSVTEDLNYLNTPSFTVPGGCAASTGETEKGYDDWHTMSLKFLFDSDSRDGVSANPEKLPELTGAILKDLRARVNEFLGPDSPINANGTSIFNLNDTIPVRFQLRDVNGSFVTNKDVSLAYKQISNNITGTIFEKINNTLVPSVGGHFKYDNINNQYFYNWLPGNLTEGEYGLQFIVDANSSKSSLLQGIGENSFSVKIGLKKP